MSPCSASRAAAATSSRASSPARPLPIRAACGIGGVDLADYPEADARAASSPIMGYDPALHPGSIRSNLLFSVMRRTPELDEHGDVDAVERLRRLEAQRSGNPLVSARFWTGSTTRRWASTGPEEVDEASARRSRRRRFARRGLSPRCPRQVRRRMRRRRCSTNSSRRATRSASASPKATCPTSSSPSIPSALQSGRAGLREHPVRCRRRSAPRPMRGSRPIPSSIRSSRPNRCSSRSSTSGCASPRWRSKPLSACRPSIRSSSATRRSSRAISSASRRSSIRCGRGAARPACRRRRAPSCWLSGSPMSSRAIVSGLVDPLFKARTLRARASFRRYLPLHYADDIEFYDPDRYMKAAPIRDNILFGRIGYGIANAETQGRARSSARSWPSSIWSATSTVSGSISMSARPESCCCRSTAIRIGLARGAGRAARHPGPGK